MSQPTPSPRIPRLMETKRIYLRPFESTDVDGYFPGLFDAEMRRLTGTQNSFTRSQVERYIENAAQDDSRLMLLIALQENDQVIGDIALMDMHTKNRSAHIRIAIDNTENQGKGYGSEALLLMLDYGFGICNLHRIELEVYAFNQRAIRTYEKLGFQREGVRRDALFYNHQYHDAIQMSILEDEFRERHVSIASNQVAES
ncbi:GNAT family protein [Paenibacillus sp. UMB7766-LJ446]|uniref:GNAT family N-acetyltransferase n=1 Tax=Paenibacillus sp. UMB7766-LJ446 TaxID=3046313 RepID=UPI00255140C1|nr:GNAT family protein [Paenibacillus sp. UMB7766-LJ446]MDK8190263.1 GNAT family protein [Paenibacillus sp. UMB7766-LJ446]